MAACVAFINWNQIPIEFWNFALRKHKLETFPPWMWSFSLKSYTDSFIVECSIRAKLNSRRQSDHIGQNLNLVYHQGSFSQNTSDSFQDKLSILPTCGNLYFGITLTFTMKMGTHLKINLSFLWNWALTFTWCYQNLFGNKLSLKKRYKQMWTIYW